MNAITSEQKYINACAFRDSAIADGWSHAPIYNTEPETTACKLERNGWVMQIYTRIGLGSGGRTFDASVTVWASDGLVVVVPEQYNFAELDRGTSYCANCDTYGVKTVRISFAGRCCEKCLPKLQEIHERRGWAD